MSLDISTLFFVLSAVAIAASAFVWFLFFNNRGTPGVSSVAASSTFLAIGFTLIALRPVLPGTLSFVVGNACVCLGYVLAFHGLRSFTGRPTYNRLLSIGVLLYCTEFSYFYYIDYDFKARLFSYLVAYGSIMLLGLMSTIVDYRKTKMRSYLAASLFQGFLAFSFLTTAAVSIPSMVVKDIFTATALNASVLFEQIIFVIGWTISFILMVNERLYAEKAAAEKELGRYALSLEASNRELEEFSFAVSHDLQEPLRNIASYAQLLQRRYQGHLDADADEFIGFMVEGVHRMKAMIQDFLEFSRLGGNKDPFCAVDLNQTVETALTNIFGETGPREIDILMTPLPTVRGIPSQLISLFQNLISNAVKYQPPGQRPILSITATHDDLHWTVRLSDNGIGIAPEHCDRIFEMFRRLHTHEIYQGTGIGLAICRRIIERHRGRIWAEANPSSGSTFAFTLPDQQP
ncbi:Sensor protein fixL [Candidatus Terasakiella magnetica]|nr:Sensor protein fixL [Candidatus Terasakiella magnetica]